MAIAALYNIPASPQTLAEWSFVNAAHHRDIARVIMQTRSQFVTEYVLDPFDPEGDLESWLYRHGAMHLNQNQILGISGYDLIGVDWNDPEKLSVWIDQHANEHLRAAQILGVD